MMQALVVDDSAVIRKVAGRILELLGFLVVTVDGEGKAREICARNMPDAILLDWSLPDNRLDFLRALRELPGGKQAKIILCATENDPLAIGQALRGGADDVVFKPFDRRDLEEKFGRAAA